jgi:hypothetical protein
VLGISPTTLSRVTSRFQRREREPTRDDLHYNLSGNRTRGRIAVACKEFLGRYFRANMEHNPTEQTSYLHNVASKTAVFQEYVDSCEFDDGVEGEERRRLCVTQTHFNSIWKQYYRHVYISVKRGFGKCNHCVAHDGLEQKAQTEDDFGVPHLIYI